MNFGLSSLGGIVQRETNPRSHWIKATLSFIWINILKTKTKHQYGDYKYMKIQEIRRNPMWK